MHRRIHVQHQAVLSADKLAPAYRTRCAIALDPKKCDNFPTGQTCVDPTYSS